MIFRFKGAGFPYGRSNIIVLINEAYRTQEGRLGDDMREDCRTPALDARRGGHNRGRPTM